MLDIRLFALIDLTTGRVRASRKQPATYDTADAASAVEQRIGRHPQSSARKRLLSTTELREMISLALRSESLMFAQLLSERF